MAINIYKIVIALQFNLIMQYQIALTSKTNELMQKLALIRYVLKSQLFIF